MSNFLQFVWLQVASLWNIGRWAHFNVKLHFSTLNLLFLLCMAYNIKCIYVCNFVRFVIVAITVMIWKVYVIIMISKISAIQGVFQYNVLLPSLKKYNHVRPTNCKDLGIEIGKRFSSCITKWNHIPSSISSIASLRGTSKHLKEIIRNIFFNLGTLTFDVWPLPLNIIYI